MTEENEENEKKNSDKERKKLNDLGVESTAWDMLTSKKKEND